LELARHVVFGAVGYARSLGFEQHPDFAKGTALLGDWEEGSSDVTFGQDGKPYPCELRSSLMASPVAAATICRASRCVALACQRENPFTPGIDSQ
jgi:hypothetical protein